MDEQIGVGREENYFVPYMPMTVIEETVDLSWVQSERTKILSEMMGCTDVGPLQDRLGERLIQTLAEEFVDPATGGLSPAGGEGDGPGEESIFDYGSTIGLLPDSEGDYWIRDVSASTWARMIVVPRKEFYHPSEGGERSSSPGPLLESLGDLRKTIT